MLEYVERKKKRITVLVSLLLLLLIAIYAGISFGAVSVSFKEIWTILVSSSEVRMKKSSIISACQELLWDYVWVHALLHQEPCCRE